MNPVPEAQTTIRTMRGIQQPLLAPPRSIPPSFLTEAKGVVYTKRWVVDLLLDLAGYRSDIDLADKLAVEPAAGEGAFLGPMIERLIESRQKFTRPISDCANARVA